MLRFFNCLSCHALLKSLGLALIALLLVQPLSAQPPIRIGVIAGLETIHGRDILRGAQLAVEEINAAGGVLGRKIELVVGDMKTEEDGELARRVYQDVASKVDAVVGFSRSEAVLAVLPDIPRMKKPLLITGATSLATDMVPTNYQNYKYVFRTTLNMFSWVGEMLSFAGNYVEKLVEEGILPNRKVVLVNEDLTLANLFMSLIGPRLGELGFEVVNVKKLAVGTEDLTPLMNELKGSGASIVFTFFSDPGLGALFTRAWAETKTKVAVFGINRILEDDKAVQELKGAATGYVIASFPTAVVTRDTIYLLVRAIERATWRTDADSLVKALESFNSYENAYIGAGGPYSFYPVAGFNPREKITLSTTAGNLEFDNCLPAGITTLCFKNPHDVRWGFKRLKDKPTAFDGLQLLWTQIGPLQPNGSFIRQVVDVVGSRSSWWCVWKATKCTILTAACLAAVPACVATCAAACASTYGLGCISCIIACAGAGVAVCDSAWDCWRDWGKECTLLGEVVASSVVVCPRSKGLLASGIYDTTSPSNSDKDYP
jgi:ABC-type branched-subunit amino acid transport system substrate-binding protein